MPEFDQIAKVKRDAEAQLRTIPGVHAVGIGKKSVGGQFTDELSINVFVVEKKPLAQLSPAEIIPPEIEGVKTDVIELAVPQLMMAGDPGALVASVSANQLSVTFSGKNPEQGGLLVVLDFSVTQGAGSPRLYVSSVRPASWEVLSDIATDLAAEITGKSITGVTAAATSATVTLTVAAGTTCAITHCDVSAIDDAQYFEDHLRGGIQLQAGGPGQGFGTLGFLATTAATAQDPQGKVVAITCQHVVAPPRARKTNLSATVTGSQVAFTKSNSQPIPLETLVDVSVDQPAASFFYNTFAGDDIGGIVAAVVAAVTQAAIPGVRATNPSPGVVAFTLPAGAALSSDTYGPPVIDPECDLITTIVGNKVTFTGEVSGDDYGVFTSADAGGIKASAGVFTQPKKGDTLSSIASGVEQAFGALAPNVRGSIVAQATANTVSFDHAETVMCVAKSDMEVGQPDNSFGSPCSHCCSHRIGRVIDAKVDVDVAVIQLDAGQKWVPEIEGLGLVTGTHAVLPAELPLNILKRGRTLAQSTLGKIVSLSVSGDIGESTAFQRHYTNAILIQSMAPNNGPISLPGDSGCAVVDFSGAIVGMIFGGGNTYGWATSVDDISSAFSALVLDPAPAPEPGHAPGDIRTVPQAAMSAVAGLDAAPQPRPFLERRLQQVQEEISATAEGADYAEAIKRHFSETQRLVNANRRVATAWHRNGGPQILQALLNMLQRRDQRLPSEIDGQPLAVCLDRLRKAFGRYSSPALAADLERLTPRLQGFAGLSYNQMLSALQSGSGD